MEQHSRSSCQSEHWRFAWLLAPVMLTACASSPDKAAHSQPQEPAIAEPSAEPFLRGLREYLGKPAGEQAAYRLQLREAADGGRSADQLRYALALSVDRDDRLSLIHARDAFQSVLAAPDPLPVALDTLVRLQLGQVMDRLQRMEEREAMVLAGQATGAALDMCRAQLGHRDEELNELRDKLHALTRIEQTVDESQEAAGERQDRDDGENDNAGQ